MGSPRPLRGLAMPALSSYGFSCHYPEPWGKKKKNGSEVAGLRSKAAGVPRRMAPLGRRTQSEKGRQGAKRPLEGGRRSGFPLQEADVGTERADAPPARTKARGIGEEVSRRLSGHGFSPEERRAKEESKRGSSLGNRAGRRTNTPSLLLTLFSISRYTRMWNEPEGESVDRTRPGRPDRGL